MSSFYQLADSDKIRIIKEVHGTTLLEPQAIEKDWWVTMVLRALYSLSYSDNLSFKGGTSLSKCWGVIRRFSEDVDIALNREFLGFSGTLSKTQISDNLRRTSCKFVRETLRNDLEQQLLSMGIDGRSFRIDVNITPITTTDPEILEVGYLSLYDNYEYILPVVKVEVSGRSMSEPIEKVNIQSLIEETFPNATFAEGAFEVNAVSPKRTFLEKICLLHEEFAPTNETIRTERMSRHLYDLSQMMDTPIAQEALADKALFDSVVAHRRQFIGLKNFDYNTLTPATIQIVPPAAVINQYQADYQTMCETMIYGKFPTFEELITKIEGLNEEIKSIGIGV